MDPTGRTIVRKNCQISVQKAAASMLATQITAPAAKNGYVGASRVRLVLVTPLNVRAHTL